MIQNTVDTSYREVYPAEAIELFKNYHSKKQVLSDAAAGYTVVAEHNGEIVGTGTLFDTNIRRVYVDPLYQHQGIGKLIVRELERKASQEKLAWLNLEASRKSRKFWESLGFIVREEYFIPVRNGQKLRFYEMVKTLL